MAQPAAPLDKLKAQIAQIDTLVAAGTLKPEAAQASRAELERQVLALVLGSPSAGAAASAPRVDATALPAIKAPRGLVAGLAVFVLAFGMVGYAAMGNRPGWSIGPGEGTQSEAPAEAAAQQAQIQAMIGQLESRLKTKPDDAEGWRMLARSYGVLGRMPEAVAAHQRVVALLPQDAQALADLADALAMANNRTLDGEPEKLILQAVKLDPSNVKALALAGTVAFNHNEFPAAVAYWERAVKVADPASGYAQQLQGALDEARQRAGLPPAAAASGALALAPAANGAMAGAAPAPAGDTGAGGTASVSGRVTLKASLKGQVAPDDTVFIFARAPSGSRMPLAILRKKVSDLPLDFKLDDSLAMSPASRLSTAQQVVVGARISKSGNAMPSPGDFQALTAPTGVGASGVALEIGEPVR